MLQISFSSTPMSRPLTTYCLLDKEKFLTPLFDHQMCPLSNFKTIYLIISFLFPYTVWLSHQTILIHKVPWTFLPVCMLFNMASLYSEYPWFLSFPLAIRHPQEHFPISWTNVICTCPVFPPNTSGNSRYISTLYFILYTIMHLLSLLLKFKPLEAKCHFLKP